MPALRQFLERGLKVTLPLAALVAVLACVPAVSARGEATATFRVTLGAQLTKTWDYVDTREEKGCAVADRVRGSRTVTLASSRPTTLRVTTVNGRPRFSPAVVRRVTARARQSGSVDSTAQGAGCVPLTHRDCVRLRRTLSNQAVQFFRSGRNELSFRRTRNFSAIGSPSCPPENQSVREEQPELHKAAGEIAEKDLFNRRVATITAGGISEETAELDGGPTGRVVTRVSWTLTFRRV